MLGGTEHSRLCLYLKVGVSILPCAVVLKYLTPKQQEGVTVLCTCFPSLRVKGRDGLGLKGSSS